LDKSKKALLKNCNFDQKYKFWSKYNFSFSSNKNHKNIYFSQQIEIWLKNQNFGQKYKFWLNREILFNNRSFGPENRNFSQKLYLLLKNGNFGQK